MYPLRCLQPAASGPDSGDGIGDETAHYGLFGAERSLGNEVGLLRSVSSILTVILVALEGAETCFHWTKFGCVPHNLLQKGFKYLKYLDKMDILFLHCRGACKKEEKRWLPLSKGKRPLPADLSGRPVLGWTVQHPPPSPVNTGQNKWDTPSFKGNAGFTGYADLEQVSHEAESLLGQIREGTFRADQEAFSILLGIIDALRDGVDQVASGRDGKILGKLGLIDFLKETKGRLEGQASREPISATPQEAQEAQRAPAPEAEPPSEQKVKKTEKRSEPSQAKAADTRRTSAPRKGSATVRVDVQKLDALLDLVGELVIAEAMVSQSPDIKELEVPLPRFEKSVLRLDKITRELQDISTSVRMIPLAGTFRKMIRLVRDLSNKAQKQTELEILGEETEVDKSIIELINDPLVHTIRNAIDHGVEKPEERQAMGKSPVGHITLEAKHESGEVWITVKDDGKGLDREKILAKAQERGLVNGNASDMRDEEVWALIFEPGFSTADQVTDISGRGVGMDVVRRNLEQIRGQVDVQSVPSEGTTSPSCRPSGRPLMRSYTHTRPLWTRITC